MTYVYGSVGKSFHWVKMCVFCGEYSVGILRLRLLLRYLRCGNNTAELHLGLASHRNIAFTLAVAVTSKMMPHGRNWVNSCENSGKNHQQSFCTVAFKGMCQGGT